MKIRQKLFAGLLGVFIVAMLGCAGLQDAITPAYIPEDAIKFAEADVPTLLPYTTITDAKYVQARLDYVRSMGELEYNFLRDNLAGHLAQAEQLRQTVFDPSGPIALLFPALAGLGIGRYLKSPREAELEKNVKGTV